MHMPGDLEPGRLGMVSVGFLILHISCFEHHYWNGGAMVEHVSDDCSLDWTSGWLHLKVRTSPERVILSRTDWSRTSLLERSCLLVS